jgi:ribosomal protein S18 acetylase RimI-like enzyme
VTPHLRPARPDDASAIGTAHVQAWRETYGGLVPASIVLSFDPAERAGIWERSIAAGRHVTVVEDAAGLAGFSLCGEQRDEALGCDGEIWAIYLLRRVQRRGLGRALMAAMAGTLLAEGRRSASLWVMNANLPAIGFYAALGGRVLARRTADFHGFPHDETAYGWDRLEALL